MSFRVKQPRDSFRSRTSSNPSFRKEETDSRLKVKECCRKMVAFMCGQVGIAGLVIGYTMVGAVAFMKIEISGFDDPEPFKVAQIRNETAKKLYTIALGENVFNETIFANRTELALKEFQDKVVKIFLHGYDDRPVEEIWSFPAALMFSLSVITMIGYGNMVPKTLWGKLATAIYALFGIPLYILYFMNMGKILAECFKWIYRRLYECSTPKDEDEPPKKIIVPSTACLWVIGAYILTGAVMFSEWEKWGFLDSTYFCVTSLCKLGLGDLVPGADINASNHGNQTKLVINFVYILLGIGLVAMCYNLMREEIRVKVKEVQEDFNQCLEDTKMRFLTCCNRIRGIDEEYVDY